MHSVVDRNAENERNADEVCRIEIDPQHPHQAERLCHPQSQRQGCQQGVFDIAEVEPEHGEDHHQRIERRLFVATFHLQRRLVGLQRVAGGAAIDTSHILDETLQGIEVPDVASAVDLEQVLAATAHESLHEARWQIVERGGFGIGDTLQSVEAADEVSGRTLLERRQRLVAVARAHGAQGVAGPFQVPSRAQGTGPLGGLRLGPRQRFAE